MEQRMGIDVPFSCFSAAVGHLIGSDIMPLVRCALNMSGFTTSVAGCPAS